MITLIKKSAILFWKKKDNCENMNLTAKIEAGKNITATERRVHCTTKKYIENLQRKTVASGNCN